jgi:hypothetical protein
MADTVLKFGKHKGSTFEEVRLDDEGYCRWVKGLSECDGQMLDFQVYLADFDIPVSFRAGRRYQVKATSPDRKPVKGPDHTELEQDQEADEEKGEPTCIICLVNRRCCVTQPCMHLHYCIACARKLVFGSSGMELKYRGEVQCPECRVDVKKIVRVHL